MGDQKNPEIWKAACMLDHFEKIQKLKVGILPFLLNITYLVFIYYNDVVNVMLTFDDIVHSKLSQDKIEGVPNFRRVPGYKVYCCGQPTVAGFEKALEKVRKLRSKNATFQLKL